MSVKWVWLSRSQVSSLAHCLSRAEQLLEIASIENWKQIQLGYSFHNELSEVLTILDRVLPPSEKSEQAAELFEWSNYHSKLSIPKLIFRKLFGGWFKYWCFPTSEINLFRWQLAFFVKIIGKKIKPNKEELLSRRMALSDSWNILAGRCYGMKGSISSNFFRTKTINVEKQRVTMCKEFTADESERHNALTNEGWSLIKGQLILDEKESIKPLDNSSKEQILKAVCCFEHALIINPEGWSSMWALGKIYQRLGDHHGAFEWFKKAYFIKPDNPEVCREAGLSALDVGLVREGLSLCQAAVKNNPADSGLICNLALALCLAGQDLEAELRALEAVAANPDDEISQNVLGFVKEVALGKRSRPKELSTVFPYR